MSGADILCFHWELLKYWQERLGYVRSGAMIHTRTQNRNTWHLHPYIYKQTTKRYTKGTRTINISEIRKVYLWNSSLYLKQEIVANAFDIPLKIANW